MAIIFKLVLIVRLSISTKGSIRVYLVRTSDIASLQLRYLIGSLPNNS